MIEICCRLRLKRKQFLKFKVLEVTFPHTKGRRLETGLSVGNPCSVSKRSALVYPILVYW